MLTSGILLYKVFYKRGVVMFSVVSLTMGNTVLPFADRLTADAERLGDELLRHLFFRPVRLERFAERAADGLLLLAHVFGLDVLSQRLDEQHEEVDDRAVDRKRDWE